MVWRDRGKLGLGMLDENQLKTIVEDVVRNGENLIAERGMSAIGPLMGIVMGKVRGRAQPKFVQKLLQNSIKDKIG